MTQLWKTGWMPNYMRHVTAGFLVEFLGLDWRAGERWYHDTLVDADVAINAYMWQNGGHSGPDQWNFVSCDCPDYLRHSLRIHQRYATLG
jgi:deoxyribodipyrimidine photolyase